MTKYLTPEQFADRFDDLSQFTAEVIFAAVADGNGITDAYIRALYPSLTPTPEMLVAATADIARRKCYKFTPPEGVKEAYDEALKLLREVARGVIQFQRPADPVSGVEESLIFSGCEVRMFRARRQQCDD